MIMYNSFLMAFRFNRLKSSAKCVIIVTIQKGKDLQGGFLRKKEIRKWNIKLL